MTTETPTDNKTLARKSALGVVWNYASFGLGKGLVFVTTAILARLLTPDDFGLVAFATLAISYLAILKDLGLGAALIQQQENPEETANTVFTLNFLLGAALTALTMVAAPWVAAFFREPQVVPLLRWLGLTFVLNSLGAIHIVRLQRELDFRRKLIPDLGRAAVKGVVSITLALMGYGVWALVFGQLAGVLAGVVLAWVAFPWLPRLRILTARAKALLHYGLSVVGVDGLTIATDNLDYLIVGRMFGDTALGIYTLAFRLPELLVLNPLWVMAGAIFPAYSKVQNQPETLRKGFLTTVRVVEIVSVPLALGLAIAADPLVRAIFGEQWLSAIPIVRLLALFVLVRSIGFNAGDVYKAIGRPDVLVKVEVLNMLALVPALIIGAQFGLVGIAWGHLTASFVRMVADMLVAAKFVNVRPRDILAQLVPAFAAGAVLAVFAALAVMFSEGWTPIVRLMVIIPAGAIGYLIPLWFLERETMQKLMNTLDISKAKKPAVIVLLLAASVFAAWQIQSATALAQSPTATPVISTPVTPTLTIAPVPAGNTATDLTLARLDYRDIELKSPIDQQTYQFGLPYRWQILPEVSFFNLNYSLQFQGGTANGSVVENQPVDALVNVFVNDELIDSFVPYAGQNQQRRIPIPAKAITGNQRQTVRVVYLSGNCDTNRGVSVLLVHNSSQFHFEYTLAPIVVDLAEFPRPVVQDLFEPEPVLFVLPDDYSDADLSAAASVAATLGQATFNNLALNVTTAANVTPELLATASAIIIGTPANNSFLQKLYRQNKLPTQLLADGATITGGDGQPITETEGVIQEIPSEYSTDYVYLAVTGNTDAAVATAAHALSTLSPRYGFIGNLVVVEEFREDGTTAAPPDDTFRLADFGFADTTFYGFNRYATSVKFFVPYNWEILDDPSFTLSYAFSTNLTPMESGLTVKLNGNPVGSAPIDVQENGVHQTVIKLQKNDFIPGTFNQLTFEAILNIEVPECTLPELDLGWLRIDANSTLYLPHKESDAVKINASLHDVFNRFLSRQDLSDLLIAMPEKPTTDELLGMLKTTAYLGGFTTGPSFAPLVSRSVVSDTQNSPYHVIAFGRPTANNFIGQINNRLPQPFVNGEDTLRQQVGDVVYRLPGTFSVGLLEIIPAPWNAGKAVLVATGTTTDGVTSAINTLFNDQVYYDLDGDIAYVNGKRVETYESKQFVRQPLETAIGQLSPNPVALEKITPTPTVASIAGATPAASGVISATIPAKDYTPPPSSAPAFLPFILIALGVLVALIGGIVSWRKNRSG